MLWIEAWAGAGLAIAVIAWFFLHRTGTKPAHDPNVLEDKYGQLLQVTLAAQDIGAIVHQADGLIVRANDAACRILGLSREDVMGRTGVHPTWTIDPAGGPPWPAEAEAVGTTFTTAAPQINVTTAIRRADGQIRWLSMKTTPLRDKDSVAYVLATFSDITETANVPEQVAWHALHDSKTGLGNRAHLFERMSHAMARSARGAPDVTLALCDIDELTVINDSRGRSVGDEVLLEAGNRLKATARDADTVARYRGGILAVLLEGGGGVEGALKFAGRLQAAFAEPMMVSGAPMAVTVSIGIGRGTSVDNMIAEASAALHRAQEVGTSQVAVFDNPGLDNPGKTNTPVVERRRSPAKKTVDV